MSQEKIHFVTGRLAESALRETVRRAAEQIGFQFSIQVMPITVAALLTARWIEPRLEIPDETTRVVLPGYVSGDLRTLQQNHSIPIELGPKDLRKLPQFLGGKNSSPQLDEYSVKIIAEINHAPRLVTEQIIATAMALQADGADTIDIGCDPGQTWKEVGPVVRELVQRGLSISVDSFNPREVSAAVDAGASLVLSVNSTNREASRDWGCEVVAIPDEIKNLDSLHPTIDYLTKHDVPFRIDPIIEPIGFGFAASLSRYIEARRRWPEAEMMMGIGNISELTDVDSAGVNMLLIAICEELKIRSVLTTQVINWARSSVRECDLARKIAFHSVKNKVPPKHLSEALVVLRDPATFEFGIEAIQKLEKQIRDHNYRIFAERDEIHLLGGEKYFHDPDPFEVFDQLAASNPPNLDPSHAFYLGYEMCKAMTALTLNKQYTQDEALNWGHLTRCEKDRHRLKKSRKKK